MDWATSLVLISALIIGCSQAATDKLESDFYDLGETEIKLSYAYGTSQNDKDMISSPRGTLTIKSFRGPRYTIKQNPFNKVEWEKLEEQIQKDNFYFLNASVMTSNGENVYHAFAPASALLESGLSDIIYIHLTPTGSIFSISYAMGCNDYFTSPLNKFTPIKPEKFNTTIIIHNGEYGPVPDTAQYLEKLEMERLAKERGDDGRDNRSFLAKYWMYIVPVALIVLLSSASQPEG